MSALVKGRDERPLRPPGAADEAAFLELCVACGCCVVSCPEQALVAIPLSAETLAAGIAGTPQIVPRRRPCTLCMVCPSRCPTGALSSVAKLAVEIGAAAVDAVTCSAFVDGAEGGCRACVDVCPFPGRAIALDAAGRPVVDARRCVGCGLCVAACPTEPESIRVMARAI